MKIARTLLGLLVTVAACGGGGSGSPAPGITSSALSGVAEVGYPIANGTVQVMCAGGGPLNTSTDSAGAWQITLSGQTPPCAIEVSGGTINGVTNSIPYHSIATGLGTVNVTPFSDLVLASLAGTATPNIWFAGLTPAAIAPITLASVNTALANQCAALSGLPTLCTTNPITTVFTPTSGNTLYNMLLALQMAMLNTGVTYTSLLNNASAPTYSAPAAGFNTALTTAYTATTAAISATAITTAQSLTVGTAMTSFSPLLSSGGTTPYTYSYTGSLPAGLSFSTSTGAVTGTPSATHATANLVFSVKDANNVVASTMSTVSFTVGAAPVNISATANSTAQSLTAGTPMTNFSPLAPSGGATPYTYSYTGSLPAGLSFSSSAGVVTGTPNAIYATASLVFSVKDANNVVAGTTSTVSFTVASTCSVSANTTAQSLMVGTAMTSFSPLLPSGCATPYTYFYTGTLPAGLIFNTSTGTVTGTPNAVYATANLVFSVKDANNAVAGTTSTVSFSVAAAPGNWTPAGSLVTIRGSSPTATLLPSGKVLITGGATGIALANAELYDPATGLSTATTSTMTTGRWGHTATLLPNGKVLVTGGFGATVLASAELYNPATGQFTATGSMTTARAQHTATLLPNGKVLIAGGTPNLATGLASAELYDPATDQFTATIGSMATARTQHTATLLANGKVLVIGGVTAAAELYDPASGLFTAIDSMTTARTSHTATLLSSGKVLVVGGLGGLASAELYDPGTAKFTPTGSMVTVTSRYAHTATLLPSGKVLVAGGVEVAGLAKAELFDPTTGLFTTTGSMAAVRISHTATLLPSGKVLVAGGASNASTELYQ